MFVAGSLFFLFLKVFFLFLRVLIGANEESLDWSVFIRPSARFLKGLEEEGSTIFG